MNQYVVVFANDHRVYGPFDDKTDAENFSLQYGVGEVRRLISQDDV